MRNKLLSLAGALAILFIGILIAKILSRPKDLQQRKKTKQGQHELVFKTVELKELPVVVESGGTIRALDKIEIYAEVTGILHQTQKPFRSGMAFKKGEALLRIDDQVYRNNVLAQKSNLLNQLTRFLPDFAIDFPQSAPAWQRYLDAFDLDKPLAPLPEAANPKEQYFIASRNIYNLFYSVKSMEATLDKYTVRAPFDGVVTEYTLNPGTLVRAGQKLGEFISDRRFELDIPVNLPDLQFIAKGDRVTLTSDDLSGTFQGKIARINAKIDPTSQTVRAYALINDARLKDGMYLQARIHSARHYRGFKIPSSWLIHSNQLYVKQDSLLVLTRVHVLRNENDFVLVNGLPDGTRILAQEFTGRAKTIRLN